MTKPVVLHLANTPCAGAVGMLSSALDEHSCYTSGVYVKRTALVAGDFSVDYKDMLGENEVKEWAEKATIIHFHNCEPDDWKIKNKPFVIQLHSEPAIKGRLVHKYPGRCCTIAQKHATLYKSIPHVPNIIPIYDKRYLPNKHHNKSLVKIVYSPTSHSEPITYKDSCRGKGYTKTVEILKLLKQMFKDKLEFDILFRVSKESVLTAKRLSDIVIDECVTGGYHLSGLEGLATGNVVLGNLSPSVADVLCKTVGCSLKELPWLNTPIEELTKVLTTLVTLKLQNPCKFELKREKSTVWMKNYYRPELLVKKYENLYTKILT